MNLVNEKYQFIDGHQDVAWSMMAHLRPFAASPSVFMLTESSWRKANLKWAWCTVFALPEFNESDNSRMFIDSMFEIYTALLAHYSGWLVPVASRDSLSLLDEFGGQTGISLLMEGADPVASPQDLEDFFTRGVRALSLTWHHSNRYAGGNAGQGGLTRDGARLINEAARLGIAIDVSHLNRESFWDLIDYRKKHVPNLPVYASHANADAVCRHERNLDDDQLSALRDANGCVGLVLLNNYLKSGWEDTGFGDYQPLGLEEIVSQYQTPAFLASRLVESSQPGPKLTESHPGARPPEQVPIDAVLDHIEHLKALVGDDLIGIGSDLDGGLTKYNTPEGIGDLGGIQLLGECIEEKWGNVFANKVMNHNWMDFWKRALP